MLESRVLGCREHPPRGLKLPDMAQPLHPRVVDEIPLCDFVRIFFGGGKGKIAVNGIVRQAIQVSGTHVCDY